MVNPFLVEPLTLQEVPQYCCPQRLQPEVKEED